MGARRAQGCATSFSATRPCNARCCAFSCPLWNAACAYIASLAPSPQGSGRSMAAVLRRADARHRSFATSHWHRRGRPPRILSGSNQSEAALQKRDLTGCSWPIAVVWHVAIKRSFDTLHEILKVCYRELFKRTAIGHYAQCPIMCSRCCLCALPPCGKRQAFFAGSA